MPPAAALIATAAFNAAGAAILGTTIFGLGVAASAAVIGFGSLALGLVSNALTPKPKRPSITGLDGSRTFQVRQPTPPGEVVYGEIKKSGYLTLAENTDNNNYVHLVVTLACHEVDAINTVYINDDPVFNDQINGSGEVTAGKFAGKLWIKKYLGTDDQAADAGLISEVAGLSSTFRQRGRAYVYVKHRTDPNLFPNGVNVAVRMRGKKLYDPRSDSTLFSVNPALVWRDYMTNSFYGYSEQAVRISDSHVTAAANVCDEFVNTLAIDHIVQEVVPASDVLELDGSLIKFHTGDRVEVTTTGTLPAGISAATSYYVIVVKELSTDDTRVEIKLAASYENAMAGTAINITTVGSGTHTVTKTGEPRYSCAGLVRLTEDTLRRDILEDILISMAGHHFKSGKTWLCYAGAWRSPSVAYDTGDIIGKLRYNTKVPRQERYNAVRGKYISAINYDQPDNYPALKAAAFIEQDGGQERYLSLDLPFSYRAQTTQRIAKIVLGKHRRMGSIVLPLDITGMLCQPGDIIEFSHARYGFVDKTFEVVDHEFAAQGETGEPTLGVTLTAREIDSGVYDFDPASEESLVLPPPSSNLPNPFRNPLPPATLTLSSGTAELYVAGEGTVISRLKATIGASPDGYVTHYTIIWKASADSLWQSQQILAASSEFFITSVADGVAYDVGVAAVNSLGRSSEFIYEYNHVVIGKTEPPPAPTEFTFARLADGTRRFTFSLDTPPPDVRVGGGFKIRYFIGATSDWAAMTPMHEGVLSVSPFETNELAAGNYTFACKAVDSTGNESNSALFMTVEVGNPRLRNALWQQIEHPFWNGTKTNCFVDTDGVLRATSDGGWEDLPATWADLAASWDTLLTNNSPIYYETDVIDLGIDTTFTPLVSVAGSGTPTLEIRTGTAADGTVVGSYGTISGQITGKRYVQIRVQMAGSTPTLETMTTILDGEVVLEEYPDVNTATESASWFNSIAAGHFQVGSREGDIAAISMAKITALQSVGAGWTWELINKSSTVGGHPAAEFKIYNSSGVLADALVDVELKGST